MHAEQRSLCHLMHVDTRRVFPLSDIRMVTVYAEKDVEQYELTKNNSFQKILFSIFELPDVVVVVS